MSNVVYSPVCDTNPAVYLAYLFAKLNNGERVELGTGEHRDRCFTASRDSGFDAGRSVAIAYRDFCRVAEVDCNGVAEDSSNDTNNCVTRFGYGTSFVSGARTVVSVSGDTSASCDRCVVVSCGDDKHAHGTTQAGDGVSEVPVLNVVSESVTVESNRERNKRNRRIKKHNARIRRELLANKRSCDVPAGSPDGGSSGFWNSCSSDVRQQLIDSKARMHIADNNRRAEEAERRVNQLKSPEQILRDAMRMVNFANEQAKKQNDSKVCGWAATVAESYAETIAKSAPTSIESYESFVQKSSVTSISIDAYNSVVKENEELKKEKDDLVAARDKALADKEVISQRKNVNSVVAKPDVSLQKRDVWGVLPRSCFASTQEHFLAVQNAKAKYNAKRGSIRDYIQSRHDDGFTCEIISDGITDCYK